MPGIEWAGIMIYAAATIRGKSVSAVSESLCNMLLVGMVLYLNQQILNLIPNIIMIAKPLLIVLVKDWILRFFLP